MTKRTAKKEKTAYDRMREQENALRDLIGSAGYSFLPQDIKDRICAQYEETINKCVELLG